MPATPPRLPSADPGNQTSYAPLSWTAVASLTVASVFVLTIAVLGYVAIRRGQPMIESWLLFFPALAILLAFVARRQIRAAEGTRAGENYANAGWWLAVVSGLCYIAYLGGIEYMIRQDANREFESWVEKLKNIDPNNPTDPALYEACYLTLQPGERAAFRATDTAAFDNARRNELSWFRQLDIVRVCARNHGNLEIRIQGLREWTLKPAEITCSLAATIVTPEGEHGIVVPMRAIIDEKKNRQWQIQPRMDGYVKSFDLTRYGWMMQFAEISGRQFTQEFLEQTSRLGQAPVAYAAFVQPGSDPDQAVKDFNRMAATLESRTAVTGTAGGAFLPPPPGMLDYMRQKLFTYPGGARPNDRDLERLLSYWNSGRLMNYGAVLKNQPDTNSTLVVENDQLVVRVPAEIAIAGDGRAGMAARAKVVVVIPGGTNHPFLKELAEAKANAASAPKSDSPPRELQAVRLPWRVVRIETDLVAVAPAPGREGPGAPGLPGMH